MRVTMKIATNTAIDNILDNYSRVLKLQNQMSTGRRVNDPSDDPLATNEGIRLQTMLAQIDQFQRNLDVGDSFLGLSDGALQDVNDLVKAAKSLTVGMASDTTTPTMRQGNVQEVHSMLSELVDIGNRRLGNRHIFGGTRTEIAPLKTVGKYVHYQGNDEDIAVQTDRGSFSSINVKATDVFGTLITTMRSDQTGPLVNAETDTGTRLESLNEGRGVAPGSIRIEYHDGTDDQILEVDLRGADTLEDVIDVIERESAGVIDVDVNAGRTGLVVTNTTGPANAIRIFEVASNSTARDLGIRQESAAATNFINGFDLDPTLTDQTLLADIPEYNGTPLTIVTGSENLQDPTFLETRDINNNLSDYDLSGLVEGVNTDLEGELYFSVTDTLAGPGGPYLVEAFKDQGRNPEDRVAFGQITTASGQGTVTLTQDNASGVSGTVQLNYIADDNDIEVTTRFPDDFRATIQVEAFRESGDDNQIARNWSVVGLQKGLDLDANGKLYVDITDGDGGAAGFTPPVTVSLYKDPAKTELVASGNLAGPSPNGTVNLTGAVGHEHVSGSVDLEYFVDPGLDTDETDIELTPTWATVEDFTRAVEESETYTTAAISEDGKSLEISSRLAGATLHLINQDPVLQEVNEDDQLTRWQLNGIEGRVNAGPDGELYAEFLTTPADLTVNLYSDSARTELVASGVIPNPGAGTIPPEQTININQVGGSGISGSVSVATDPAVLADDTDIELRPQVMGLTGQRRESNIFATFTDTIEAGQGNDTETLHNLLGNYEIDNRRVLDSRADVGAKLQRFEMLRNRHADENTSFTEILSKRIDLDFAKAIVDFQAQSNIFNSSLSVAGRIIPMSLVDFI